MEPSSVRENTGAARPFGPRYKWAVLGTVSVGSFLSALENGSTTVALPSIGADLHVGLPVIQWVVLINFLITGSLVLPVGRAADILGHKRFYLLGQTLFAAGSALALTSPNVAWLFVARAVQALGAAGLGTNARAISVAAFPRAERGRVLGIGSSLTMMGTVSGMTVGGLMVDSFGWRSLYVPAVVLGPMSAIVAFFILQETRESKQEHQGTFFDWPGMITSVVCTVALLLAVTRGAAIGWTSPFILTLLAISALAFAWFIRVELRTSQPMVDLRLFRNRRFSAPVSAAMLSQVAMPNVSYLMAFYLQGVHELRPRVAGLFTTPLPIGTGVGGLIGGFLSDRLGPRFPATAGWLIMSGGMLVFAQATPGAALWQWLVGLSMCGLGNGICSPANASAVLGAVKVERYGVVSGVLQVSGNIGRVSGTTLTTLIITGALTGVGVAPGIGHLLDRDAADHAALVRGFMNGWRVTSYLGAGLFACAALLSVISGTRREDAAAEPVGPPVSAEPATAPPERP